MCFYPSTLSMYLYWTTLCFYLFRLPIHSTGLLCVWIPHPLSTHLQRATSVSNSPTFSTNSVAGRPLGRNWEPAQARACVCTSRIIIWRFSFRTLHTPSKWIMCKLSVVFHYSHEDFAGLFSFFSSRTTFYVNTDISHEDIQDVNDWQISITNSGLFSTQSVVTSSVSALYWEWIGTNINFASPMKCPISSSVKN